MDIKILGAHNCESQNSRFISLLVDDVLVIDAGSLTSGLSLAAQQKLRAILISHQHYDHIRDIPAIAMNLFLHETTINLYTTQNVHQALTTHLLNGKLYPKFHEFPEANPTVKLEAIEPLKLKQIAGYGILAVPVNHSQTTVGYQVTAADGKSVFYTADTGPGLTDCWQHIAPQLLITEVTAPNRYQELAQESGHLTPSLLKRELTNFQELKGYLPEVVVVHMNPVLEPEIAAEIKIVAQALDNPITLAWEGMRLKL